MRAYAELTGDLTDEDGRNLASRPRRWRCWSRRLSGLQAIIDDIAEHYPREGRPERLRSQIVTFDQEACVLYKQALDKILPPEASDIVISVSQASQE